MKTPYLIALVMTAAIILWMASGLLRAPQVNEAAPAAVKSDQRMLVQTHMQHAQSVQLTLTVQGQVEPNRSVSIRSDMAGRISEVLVDEGQWVQSQTVLLRLGVEDRHFKLLREQALLESKQKAYARAQSLEKENFQSKNVLEDAFASLTSAQASVALAELELKKLNIKAPFSGVLDTRMVEQGGYVSANEEVGRFVDNRSLVVVVPVAQKDIQQLTLGGRATVMFSTGESREGTVGYISSVANEATRTFRVEVTVDNADLKIPAGISAEVTIPTHKKMGHFVSPAILDLDTGGQMGVKVVDDAHTVVFYPVSIIQATTDGLWVVGLPDTAAIITVGQGFVAAGVQVEVEQAGENPSQ